MAHRQGTTQTHPTNQQNHSNAKIAKAALKSLEQQTKALNEISLFLLSSLGLISFDEGLFAPIPITITYCLSEAMTLITFISIVLCCRKTHLRNIMRNCVDNNIPSLFNKHRIIPLWCPGKYEAEKILTLDQRRRLSKGKKLKHTHQKRIGYLAETYGIQVTLLIPFISHVFSNYPNAEVKCVAAWLIPITTIVYSVCVTCFIMASNQSLVNFVLTPTKE